MSPHAARSVILDPPEGAAPPSPVLHAAILARIRELNYDYLDLLITPRGPARLQAQRFSAATLAALTALSSEERRRLAAAPYTLFRLVLDGACLWSTPCNAAAPSTPERYASSTSVGASFCETALMHAWCVGSSARVALRLTYGLTDEVARRLSAAPLWRLKRIAHDHPEVLAPRWPTNPAFWPQLATLAAAGDEARLRSALLLGHQLIAGELERSFDSQHRARSRV